MSDDRCFEVLACSLPSCAPDASLAIAGSRAGAVGILDLELCGDPGRAARELARLARFAGGPFGVRIPSAFDLHAVLLPALPAGCTTIILAGGLDPDPAPLLARLRGLPRRILLECVSAAEAEAGLRLGIQGLIAKGHEAGGRVGDETTFILLQRLLAGFSLPVWAQGGIGLHTAAACLAAGAAGAVLDAQLALARESPLGAALRAALSRADGRDTVLLGEALGRPVRACTLAGRHRLAALREEERRLAAAGGDPSAVRAAWTGCIAGAAGLQDPDADLLLLGQDLALAPELARRLVTAGGIVQAIRQAARRGLALAGRLRPLAPESALARAHGTRYPVVQGPMARVSDVPAFAAAVAEAGGLPFMAAAWLRAPELEAMLAATRAALGERPWGVGLLGFLPAEIWQEQVAVLKRQAPPFALVAGGRPEQVLALEGQGIATYVHVPSLGLLDLFLAAGCRRLIFEGREAGGHVGPLSSFVLWQAVLDRLAGLPASRKRALSLLFAGGLRDASSAAMVAAMTAELAEAGAAVGLQVGSAYLFTREAVASGAIVEPYRRQLLASRSTTLLESGPGHAVRCLDTPFARRFQAEKARLAAAGIPAEEARRQLELFEQGRLRLAAKGVARVAAADRPGERLLTPRDEAEQLAEGIYMVGQMAGIQDQVTTVAGLHQELCAGATAWCEQAASASRPAAEPDQGPPLDIAIIGLGGFFPDAPGVERYWENILNRVSPVREIPAERWDWRLYFDAGRQSPDRIYARWGTFLDEVPFDPVAYGMPPKVLHSVEPLHLLCLEAVRQALA
ncbi:MAG: nitronate monooxygenase, partial [Thermodesulfobacteriota bacterium]